VSVVGYARVSTVDQETLQQEEALEAAGCDFVFRETASGARAARPELERCLARLKRGDTLMVWSLDRLGRNFAHLVAIYADLDDRGVILRSLKEGIDTSTDVGRMMRNLLAVFAAFEREKIRERTLLSIQSRRARGLRVGGPNRVVTARKLAVITMLSDSGEATLEQIAATVGVSRSSVVRALREHRAATR
jgi:DNA invertase Pin-like site-specific DNA recombinase